MVKTVSSLNHLYLNRTISLLWESKVKACKFWAFSNQLHSAIKLVLHFMYLRCKNEGALKYWILFQKILYCSNILQQALFPTIWMFLLLFLWFLLLKSYIKKCLLYYHSNKKIVLFQLFFSCLWICFNFQTKPLTFKLSTDN